MCVNNFKGRRYMFLLQGTLKKTDLWESDLNVTDEYNFTLLMMAALHNRYYHIALIPCRVVGYRL